MTEPRMTAPLLTAAQWRELEAAIESQAALLECDSRIAARRLRLRVLTAAYQKLHRLEQGGDDV